MKMYNSVFLKNTGLTYEWKKGNGRKARTFVRNSLMKPTNNEAKEYMGVLFVAPNWTAAIMAYREVTWSVWTKNWLRCLCQYTKTLL